MRTTRLASSALGSILLPAALSVALVPSASAGPADPVVNSSLLPPNPGFDPDAVLAAGPGTRALFEFTGNYLWSLPEDTTTAWRHEPNPPAGFTPRSHPLLAWDPGANRLLVYGGQSDAGALEDLWAFDPATDTWTLLDDEMSPAPALGAHATTFDPAGNRTVVLAGIGSGGGPTLWALTLDPAPAWVEIPTTGMPAFTFARIACDTNANRVLLLDNTGSVWSVGLAGGAWSILPTTNSPPVNVEDGFQGGLVGFDPSRDALFVIPDAYPSVWFAARLQLAETSTWYPVPVSPAPGLEPLPGWPAMTSAGGFDHRTLSFHAWLPNLGLCEIPTADIMPVSFRAWGQTFPERFGGYDPASRAFWFHSGDQRQVSRQSFDDPLAVELFDVSAPTGTRTNPGVALDPAEGRLLFFGGAHDGVPQADLRALVLGTPPAWQEIVTAGPPPAARHDPRVVLDTRRHRLVVLEVLADGGPTNGGPLFPVLDLDAVPPTWSRVSVTGAEGFPGWRWDAVYDSTTDRILAVDDLGSPVAAGTGVTVAIALDGFPIRITGLAGGRGNRDPHLTLDLARRLLVESGGVNTFQTVRDVWVLPLDAPGPWRKFPTTDTPPAIGVADGLGAYDPVRDRILILGGFSCFALGGHTGSCRPEHGLALQFDPETPTRLDVAEAEAVTGGIRVRFAGEGSSGEVRVERSSDRGASWEALGLASEVTPGVWEYVDADAVPGTIYRYRGRYDTGEGERTTAWSPDVARPAGAAVALALAPRAGAVVRVWPVEFAVTLMPGAGDATLELVDVAGRVVARQRIESGARTVTLAPERAAGAGLYFVRLRQGSSEVRTRIVRL